MREIVLGTGPVRLGPEGDTLRSALGTALGAAVGTDVRVRVATAPTYPDLLAQIAKGEVDLAWVSPALALRAIDRRQAVALVSTRRSPGAQFFGVIFALASSKIASPQDLAWKSIAWVDRDSCSGYLFPRLALAAAGIKVEGFFSEERFLGSHAAVAKAVASGESFVGATFYNVEDVAVTGDRVSTGWGAVTLEAMQPVLATEPIPADLIVASTKLPADLRERVTAALVAAHGRGGASMLATLTTRLLGAFGFERADLRRYEVVRTAMKT